jgi:Tol biopolymer transport system component
MRMTVLARWLGPVLLALVSLFVAPLSARPAPLDQDLAPYDGELLYVNNGEIWRLNLATNEQSPLVRVPNGFVSHLAHSPDRRRIAYAVSSYTQIYSVGSSDIMVCDVDGTNPQTVVHEDGGGFVVGAVSWSSDPSRLIYGKTSSGRGPVERVEEVNLSTGERSLVVDEGSAPAASPTGPLLAYQTRVGSRFDIWKLDRQTGARAEIVKADWFDDVDHPRFSPDGATVAFVAAGSGPPPQVLALPILSALFDLGQPRVAAAHDMFGVLSDLWVVQPDGGGLRRVAQLFDSQPEIAWSPTGRHIAALGSFQLQIVDVVTGSSRTLPRPAGTSLFSSALSWGDARGN